MSCVHGRTLTPLPRQEVSEHSGSHVTELLGSWNLWQILPLPEPISPPILRKGQGLQMEFRGLSTRPASTCSSPPALLNVAHK